MDALRLLGSLLGNNATGGGVGGALLNSILKGGGQSGGGGGLGGLLGGASGGGGGLGDLLGGVLGGGQQGQSGQQAQGGGLLGGLVTSALGRHAQSSQGGGLSDALGGLLGGGQDPVAQMPQQEAEDGAKLLIRAMCNAAKADGQIDQQEQQNIIGRLGSEVDQEEVDFLRQELSAPLDAAGLARQVPSGMEQQVYAMSVMAINVDTQAEAQYLGQLAQGLGLDGDTCNQIHTQLNAPKIFT